MKIAISLALVVVALASTDALRCWTCENESSLSECIRDGELKQCRVNEDACETHIRRDQDKYTYFKTCKQANACFDNARQNPGLAATPVQCNDDGHTSVCRCCCYRDDCGKMSDDCTDPIICKDPPPIGDSVRECQTSRIDSLFDEGDRCSYICDNGVHTIRCKDINHEGAWFPPIQNLDCRMNPPPFCPLPPVWEEGIVNCANQRPEGGWEIGDRCDFICPEGSEAVGNTFSICTQSTNPDSGLQLFNFQPSQPPCCEPRCDTTRPADILFVLDHSTSIRRRRWPIITTFVSDVVGRFDMTFVRFGVILYSKGVQVDKNIPFNYSTNSEELQDEINGIRYEPSGAGTQTTAALQYAVNNAFTPSFGDRPDVPNYVIFITDGVSTDNRKLGDTFTLNLAADDLKAAAKGVYAVGINVPESSDELDIIATKHEFVARIDDFDKLNGLLDSVIRVVCDRQCEGFVEPILE